MSERSTPAEMTVAAEKYLPAIHTPADLRALPAESIPALCQEIRETLVETVTSNGGHLASNLGAVELSVAMHRVFDCPRDHFIFDVGHQSYVHKLLTGRYEQFSTLRKGGGLSGFTKRSESEYDCFGAGHSSTSLSAALGFAQGDRMSGSEAFTVAVIGDGAFTGGMIHEALNNVTPGLRLIIIINENEMSISKNIGRFATHMARLRRKSGYFKTKKGISRFIKRIPLIGGGLFRAIRDTKKAFKNAMYGSNYFEDLGLYYLGPADGNDYEAVETLLSEAKKLNDSVVIHLKTRKGKGYAPAEAEPGKYHGMPPKGSVSVENFSHRLGEILIEESAKDDRICAITAAMSEGTGLESFREARPDRFFDVGIAEEHALTFAAGLAADGYRVDYEAIRASTPDGNVNRALIAKALLAGGYVPSVKAAFHTLLGEGMGYYTPPTRPDFFDTIRFLRSIRAVPVWAHPLQYMEEATVRQALPEAVEAGLAGMEVMHSSYDETTVTSAKALAHEFGLLCSGGSDFHGAVKPDVYMGVGSREGTSPNIPDGYYPALRARAEAL